MTIINYRSSPSLALPGGAVDAPPLRLPPPELDAARLGHLRAFVAGLGEVFPRADQRQRLETLLRGLLDGQEPKSAEGIARRAGGDGQACAAAQALQHFLASSPW